MALGLKITDGSNHLTVVHTRLFYRDSFPFNSLPSIFRNLCSVISVSLVTGLELACRICMSTLFRIQIVKLSLLFRFSSFRNSAGVSGCKQPRTFKNPVQSWMLKRNLCLHSKELVC